MTVERLPDNLEKPKANWSAIAIAVVFALIAFWVTRPEPSLQSRSSVSGLMTLKTTVREAIPYEVALATPKPSLVEFYADWCTTCQAMAPTLQSVHQQMEGQVNFVMIDIDDPRWLKQVKQFQVSGVPHLALLNSDHTVVDTFIGEVPKQVLNRRLADLLS
ncbi:MAG: thioredoxin domain-containing protein [Cyanobacteria bacterium J06626_18]